MAIRYDKKLNAEIRKQVNNFNAKIRYYEKQGKLLLPEKVSISDIKDTSYTRQDIRRKLNRLKRLNKKSVELVTSKGGVTSTIYEKRNLEIEFMRASRKINNKIKKFKQTRVRSFGKNEDVTIAEMFGEEMQNVMSKRQILNENKISNLNLKERERLKRLLTRINNQQISPTFKNNYIDALTSTGYFYDYDTDKLKTIEDKLDKLTDEDFTSLFSSDVGIKSILDYYKLLKMQSGFNPSDAKDDVKQVYDAIYDNIDDILKNY